MHELLNQEKYEPRSLDYILESLRNPDSRTPEDFHDSGFDLVGIDRSVYREHEPEICELMKGHIDRLFVPENMNEHMPMSFVKNSLLFLGYHTKLDYLPWLFDFTQRSKEYAPFIERYEDDDEVKVPFLDQITIFMDRQVTFYPREVEEYSDQIISQCKNLFYTVDSVARRDDIQRFVDRSTIVKPLYSRFVKKEVDEVLSLLASQDKDNRESHYSSMVMWMKENLKYFERRDPEWLDDKREYVTSLMKWLVSNSSRPNRKI